MRQEMGYEGYCMNEAITSLNQELREEEAELQDLVLAIEGCEAAKPYWKALKKAVEAGVLKHVWYYRAYEMVKVGMVFHINKEELENST